jgi:acetate---CoA ligase (ADP-forming)
LLILLKTMTKLIALDEVFNPTSVAIVGASPEKLFSFANQVVYALKEAAFPAIYPVNPRYTEAYGLPCYPSVSAIPGQVDHVVVCIPAQRTLDLMDDCARKHVHSVQFFSAGYRETGEASGVELEQEMLRKARAGGFRIVGPNCTGIYVPRARFTFAQRMPLQAGGIAFISQSGGHAHEVPYHGGPRGLRFSKVISYGNALDINECELLEYLIDDPDTRIIAAYIEGVTDGARFRSALENAARKKPVVIYKGGNSEAGLRAARSHTASMTSSVRVFQALCQQANTIQVSDIHELMDVLVALSLAVPYPRGSGVASFGVGGGPTVEAGDYMEKFGLRVPGFSAATRSELKGFLDYAGAIFANPLDATNLVVPDIIYRTLRVIGKDPEIDMMMYQMGFHPTTKLGDGRFLGEFSQHAPEALHKASVELGKPVLMALGPGPDKVGMDEFLGLQDAFVKANVAIFHSIEKAALAMSRVVRWHKKFAADLAASSR